MRTSFGGALGALGALTLVFACGTSDDPAADGSGSGGGTTTGDGGTSSTSSGDGATGTTNPDGGVSPSYVPFDVNHVLVTGQSNETGNDATTILSVTQPYQNLMFDTGPMSMAGGYANINRHAKYGTIAGCDDNGCTTFQTPTSFQPLHEGDTYFDDKYSDLPPYRVETPASGLANQITKIATSTYGLAQHVVLASVDGRSGNAYACLRKGGGCENLPNYGTGADGNSGYKGYLSSFEQSMREVTAAKALAAAAGKSYVVRGVAVVHGEQDSDNDFNGSPDYPLAGTDGTANAITSYTDALLEWQRDLESGAKAITGQTQPVPIFVSQLSNWSAASAAVIPQRQLDAHVKAPGKVVVIGPSYPLPFNGDDCLHFTSEGERRLGEYFGKVYAAVVLGGKTWEPVRPRSVVHSGLTVTIQFHVPVPPLAFDTTQVAEAPAKGFAVTDGNGTPRTTITNVALTGPDTVTLTLAGNPGTGARLRYAMNHEDGACVGPLPVATTEQPPVTRGPGARGNLRDSDATPAQSGGAPLQNWGVHFDLPLD